MPFYCNLIPCDRFRIGFAVKSARDEHLKVHIQRYKCRIPDCIYSDVGFTSQQALSQHMDNHDGPLPVPEAAESSSGPEDNETFLMLQDAVIHDDVSILRGLGVPGAYVEKLLHICAWKSGSETLDYLLEVRRHLSKSDQVSLEAVLAVAIETDNRPIVFQLLHEWSADIFAVEGLPEFIARHVIHKDRAGSLDHRMHLRFNGFARALSLWNPDLVQFLVEDCGVVIQGQGAEMFDFCRAPALAGLTSDEVNHRFEKIKKYLICSDIFSDSVSFAIMYKSVEGLRICLENGGNPNVKYDYLKPFLHRAIETGTHAGAEMAKLLLKYGADPNYKWKNGRRVVQLVAMKQFEAYFGGNWNDIVRRIQSGEDVQRDQGPRPSPSKRSARKKG